MSNKVNPLKEIGNKNPFQVPEGYFERLSDRILSQLPERIVESPQPPSLWQRVQPWVYMAAMFCGIALMVNLFTRTPHQPDASGLNLTSSADIEAFYQYYEEQLTNNVYNEAIYVNLEQTLNF
ncbi:MAG: hypothetical protein LBB85_02600 [Dysgonamonadaceae bacterium]|jgi:hypothetical protein|nr:hypothetical protein [Dysgonamonadaceae bacterium]